MNLQQLRDYPIFPVHQTPKLDTGLKKSGTNGRPLPTDQVILGKRQYYHRINSLNVEPLKNCSEIGYPKIYPRLKIQKHIIYYSHHIHFNARHWAIPPIPPIGAPRASQDWRCLPYVAGTPKPGELKIHRFRTEMSRISPKGLTRCFDSRGSWRPW